MIATLVRPMSKAARSGEGAPRKKDKWVVKLDDDLGEMVSWIVKLRGGTAATYIGPLIRKKVQDDYKDIEKEVEIIKRAQAKHRPAGEAEDE